MGGGLLLLAASGIGLLHPFENVSYTVLSPIQSALRSFAQPFADVVTRYGNVRDLTRENDALRSENERLTAELARLREEATRREELERLLDTRNALANQEFAAASVIARDPTSQRQRVAIDRGSADGLREGMPVVTEGSTLVGTVTKVEENHSWVTLVTDVDSAVSSSVSETGAQGVTSGRYDGTMQLEFLDQRAAVKAGDTVVTSGLGGSYPEGLVVGKVTKVEGSAQELFQRVTVEPLATLSHIETLLVMTSFTPTRLTSP